MHNHVSPCDVSRLICASTRHIYQGAFCDQPWFKIQWDAISVCTPSTLAEKEEMQTLNASHCSFPVLPSEALAVCPNPSNKLEYIYKPEIVNPLSYDLMKQAYEKSCDQKDWIVYTPVMMNSKLCLHLRMVLSCRGCLLTTPTFSRRLPRRSGSIIIRG